MNVLYDGLRALAAADTLLVVVATDERLAPEGVRLDMSRTLSRLSELPQTSLIVLGYDSGTSQPRQCIHLVGDETRPMPTPHALADLRHWGGAITAHAVTALVSNDRGCDDWFGQLGDEDMGISVDRIVPGAHFRVEGLTAAASILDMLATLRYVGFGGGCRSAAGHRSVGP